MCIHREIEAKLASHLRQFKVALVTGARQGGKTTPPRHSQPGGYEYVTLDSAMELSLALRNAMAGHMFETFVVSEVLKSYMNAGRDLRSILRVLPPRLGRNGGALRLPRHKFAG